MADVVLETIARQLMVLLKTHINDAIDAVWSEMVAEDAAYATAMGETAITLPKPYPTRFFLGHHPSILEREATDYPNLTVVSYEHDTVGDLDADQYEVVGSNAYAEAWVMHSDETIVNRLAWRYAKAIHRVVTTYKDLSDNDVEPINLSPSVTVSNALSRRVSEFTDEITFIQGCRLEYTFKTVSPW